LAQSILQVDTVIACLRLGLVCGVDNRHGL
jgi:hypothetical protein